MARHPGLDATRTVATLLVVATHAALSFMVTPIGWAIQDGSQFLGVDLYVWIVRAFGMPLFFWLSGYSARSVLVYRGARRYVHDRFVRLLVPLALAIVPCTLALDALWDWGRDVATRAAVPAHIPKLQSSELPIMLGHLWYLYYLLFMSFVALGIARVLRGFEAPPGAALLVIPAGFATGALVYLGALQTDTPLGFAPDLPILAYMGGFFTWGWLVNARPAEIDRYRDRAWHALAAGGALLAVVIPSLAHGHTAPPLHAVAASGLFSVVMVIAFLGVCVRYLSRPRPWLRLASEASYWSYIAHLPIVVALQIVLAQIASPGILEYAAIVAVTMTLCLGSYGVVVRLLRNVSRINAAQR